MAGVVPKLAAVRPRVFTRGDADSRPIEDAVCEIANKMPRGVIRVLGNFGSGKSTAVAHLAAALADDDRFGFLDNPTDAESKSYDAPILVAASGATNAARGEVAMSLAPWSLDEFVEYLLATCAEACAGVLARLGSAAQQEWAPQLAAIILDRFAADGSATDVAAELRGYVVERLPKVQQLHSVQRYCLAMCAEGHADLTAAVAAIDCPEDVRRLVRQDIVATQLAADGVVRAMDTGSTDELRRGLPRYLVAAIGVRCRDNPAACRVLRRLLDGRRTDSAQAMAGSIYFAADPAWRPTRRIAKSWQLGGGYFPGAMWPGVALKNADLQGVDLSEARLDGASLVAAAAGRASFVRATLAGANLARINACDAQFAGADLGGATLDKSILTRANFVAANLTGAVLVSASLEGADFSAATMVRANLTGAKLQQAKLEDADLTDATMVGANLALTDLRMARLWGATLEQADLTGAQLDEVRLSDAMLRYAVLRGAHLTGSVMPRADLRWADLSGAGLAEIEWAGADLREANLQGATFHLGSSRSGLVGSPIACEGSKTGFYTDDYEDMHFKRPEEIRKANLCGADLRGAKIEGLDFYLVDLRAARLDRRQLEHVRRCGAILTGEVA